MSLIFIFFICDKKPGRGRSFFTIEVCFVLLFYANFFYGGLYQNNAGLFAGTVFFFAFVTLLFINHYVLKNKIRLFPYILPVYFLMGVWTVWTSPKPFVDTFDVFTQVAQKLASFQNPYSAAFIRTYPGIDNHFHYLPFSFIITFPFTALLGDPRYSIIFFNLLSAIILKIIFDDKIERAHLSILLATFLFLPRSFYMLEHMYLDPIIFSFFLLFYFFYRRRIYRLSIFFLALFFSFKQNLFVILPLFILDKTFRTLIMKHLFVFTAPFLLIIFFLLLNPASFLLNTFFGMFGAVFYPHAVRSTPTDTALSFQVFIRQFASSIKTVYLYGISSLFLLVAGFKILLLNRSHVVHKIFLMLFALGYFMHLSFFNHYYFTALFYFFSLMLQHPPLKKIPKTVSQSP
jgi:hypothetical protein